MATDQPHVTALIPAAGSGVRLGGQRKQFRLLGGRPLLLRTIEVFHGHPAVASVVVAVPQGEMDAVHDLLSRELPASSVIVVEGGPSRRESVARALQSTPPEAGIVLVHDAVRPFVPPWLISDVISATGLHGAAAAALPLSDTLRRGDEDVFGETVPRDGLFRMQTPQGFRRDWLEEAHRVAAESGADATDDVDLVQKAGFRVRIVDGTPLNIKITTPADWDVAEKISEIGEVSA